MTDEYWFNFTKTGKISDYLEYKQHENSLKAECNENIHKGTCYKGTDNRGE